MGYDDKTLSVQESLTEEIRKHSLIQAEMMRSGKNLSDVQQLGLKKEDDSIEAELE